LAAAGPASGRVLDPEGGKSAPGRRVGPGARKGQGKLPQNRTVEADQADGWLRVETAIAREIYRAAIVGLLTEPCLSLDLEPTMA
jgi:hypothetical protein